MIPSGWKESFEFRHLDKSVRSYEFNKNDDKPNVYKKVSGSAVTLLVLYVEDVLLIENDISMLQSVKTTKHFSMKN